MEDKIEIGEYVRTTDGKFGIFDRYSTRKDDSLFKSPFNCFIKLQNRKTSLQRCRDYIVKHSKNIIDLIEVGDLIELRGAEKLKYEVLKISYSPSKGKHIHIINPFKTEGGKDIFIEDIKSIVTKEQFSSIEYKIEEG